MEDENALNRRYDYYDVDEASSTWGYYRDEKGVLTRTLLPLPMN